MLISDTLSQGSQSLFNLKLKNVGTSNLFANLGAIELSPPAAPQDDSPAPAAAVKDQSPETFRGGSGDDPEPLNIWLFVSPAADTIAPGDSIFAQVTLTTSSIGPGTYNGRITITSNDPDESTVNVPVTLLVQATGSPDINLSRTSFTDTVQTGNSIIRNLYVGNTGVTLLYYGLHDNRSWISIVPDTGNVPASQSDTVVVTLNASALAPGTYTGQLNVNSNDPDESLVVLPVTLVVTGGGGSGCVYVIGDVNDNGEFNGIDVTYSTSYFKGGPVPPYACECTPGDTWFVAGDVNGNCQFNGIDITLMVAYFKGGPSPIPCPDCSQAAISLRTRGGQTGLKSSE
jgi:hypothetical protein